MAGQYHHLGLIRWPFPIVPEREFCTFLADRQQLRLDIAGLLTTLFRRDASSIHLFWSWFGAGKTHTLFYLANQADKINKRETQYILYPVYSEFPKSARSFLDLYRSFVTELNLDILIDAFLEIYTAKDSDRLRRDMMLASPDLVNALQVMATGESQDHITAMRWLRAESLPISEFRKVGVSQKINSSEEATRILAALIEMLAVAARCKGYPGCRVIWLLDEFQRIEHTGSRVSEINTGLHSTFNACPRGLSLFLSFSGKPQTNNLPPWVSRELRDRIGRTKVMILPPMLPEEALGFIRDIFAQFRTPEFNHQLVYFPFTEQTCKIIIEEVSKKDELKPRAIMHAFNAVLQEADPKIEVKEFDVISPDFAKRVLAEYMVLSDSEEN
ncbi:MAG: ATP-binding protein [Nitrososphaera sp.]|nr:ATP-binding protein [Nitrososphaera sp.]